MDAVVERRGTRPLAHNVSLTFEDSVEQDPRRFSTQSSLTGWLFETEVHSEPGDYEGEHFNSEAQDDADIEFQPILSEVPEEKVPVSARWASSASASASATASASALLDVHEEVPERKPPRHRGTLPSPVCLPMLLAEEESNLPKVKRHLPGGLQARNFPIQRPLATASGAAKQRKGPVKAAHGFGVAVGPPFRPLPGLLGATTEEVMASVAARMAERGQLQRKKTVVRAHASSHVQGKVQRLCRPSGRIAWSCWPGKPAKPEELQEDWADLWRMVGREPT